MPNDWIVAKKEFVSARWFKDGAEVVTGSSSAKYIRNNGGVVEYLQSDRTTFGTTSVSHTQTYSAATGWTDNLTIPASMDGFTIVAESTHSDTTLPKLYEDHYVTKSDRVLSVELGG